VVPALRGVPRHVGAVPRLPTDEVADLWGADRQRQNAAYASLMEATDVPVDWAHDTWDEVVANLTHADNHNRAIAGQLLCNLAAHDPTDRILGDLDALMKVTKDERFVTAVHPPAAVEDRPRQRRPAWSGGGRTWPSVPGMCDREERDAHPQRHRRRASAAPRRGRAIRRSKRPRVP
jgi:hypothetical protein